MNKKSLLPFFLIVVLVIIGCEQTTTLYLGAQADKKEAVALVQGEVTNQNWKDLYISVDYSYRRDGNHLGMKGILSFTNSSQINYQRVPDLRLKLFFLDKNLQVVEYFNILRTLSSDLEQEVKFNQTFKLPATVTAFTFGYQGVLAEGQGRRSQIWNMPKRDH